MCTCLCGRAPTLNDQHPINNIKHKNLSSVFSFLFTYPTLDSSPPKKNHNRGVPTVVHPSLFFGTLEMVENDSSLQYPREQGWRDGVMEGWVQGNLVYVPEHRQERIFHFDPLTHTMFTILVPVSLLSCLCMTPGRPSDYVPLEHAFRSLSCLCFSPCPTYSSFRPLRESNCD